MRCVPWRGVAVIISSILLHTVPPLTTRKLSMVALRVSVIPPIGRDAADCTILGFDRLGYRVDSDIGLRSHDRRKDAIGSDHLTDSRGAPLPYPT